MITLRDLFDSGVLLQGYEIIVKYFNEDATNEKDYYTVVVHGYDELCSFEVDEKYLDKNIKYIYADNKSLVIEIEEE